MTIELRHEFWSSRQSTGSGTPLHSITGVGATVGCADGVAVGFRVGLAEGDADGERVGVADGATEGAAVGDGVTHVLQAAGH